MKFNNMSSHKVTAFVYNKKGMLLSVGKNSYIKTHTIQAKYGKMAGKPSSIYLHAEIDALIKARNRGGVPHRIFVARYYRDGSPAMAKPCPICMAAITDFGIEIIEWTVGEFNEELINSRIKKDIVSSSKPSSKLSCKHSCKPYATPRGERNVGNSEKD
jgi:deoxycytidylate deaminase